MKLFIDTRYLIQINNCIFFSAGKKTARNLEDGLFSTPYGKSYFCPSPDVINMYNSRKDKIVLARMKDVHLQVYDIHNGKFSPCK